ncbi:VWA domain-containing protein [Pirellulales bacterium]|nr:VWA domain-containing protein [Pirellulales bacterium]
MTAPFPKPCRRRSRRGAMLALVALLLPVLLIFLGFSVDLAYMQMSRMELRAATDVAARAGATELARTDDLDAARAKAIAAALENTVAGNTLSLRDEDVVVGRAEPNAEGKWIFDASGWPPNSVRVIGNRQISSLDGGVPLFFGQLIGTDYFEPVLSSTASFLNVDICLVLDRSTSMKVDDDSSQQGMYTSDPRFCAYPTSTSRWQGLDTAVRIFITELGNTQADEQVALATYGSDLSQYNPPLCGSLPESSLDHHLDNDLSSIEDAMDDYLNGVWNGNTAIEAGMRNGMDALNDTSYARAYADKIMIVLTDGNENVGSAQSAADDCAAQGIIVHSITFSDYANQQTMQSVANTAGGRHYHAPNSAALADVFRELAAQVARLTQ